MRVIGVDESGKGDFFGPLVIAALVADDSDTEALRALGVRDSKTITDNRILTIAAELERRYQHSVIVIGPEKYNTLYKQIKNLNKLLGWGHARAIENLLAETTADLAISDKFGEPHRVKAEMTEVSEGLELRLMVRGESVVQVAAASILARATFVRQMQRLAEKFGVVLPKGASAAVDAAGREIVAKYGLEVLNQVAKTHFKNYARATSDRLTK
jgi:ribonuclease HIII